MFEQRTKRKKAAQQTENFVTENNELVLYGQKFKKQMN